MKIKTITLLTMILLFFASAKGQNAFPLYADNPTWKVNECEFIYCSYTTYAYEYDTTFCGKKYSKTSIEKGIYVRSDSTKAFFRKSTKCSDKEYLLYDYSKKVGDSVYVAYNLALYPPDTMAFKIMQIDTVIYFGSPRQRFKMKFDRCSNGGPVSYMYWIKGIGSLRHPFYPFYCLCDICETGASLACFSNSNTTNSCDTLQVGIPSITDQPELKTVPNPFMQTTTIELKNIKNNILSLYSIKGELITSFHGQSRINIGQDLPSGIYFITVQTDNFTLTKKLIKIE